MNSSISTNLHRWNSTDNVLQLVEKLMEPIESTKFFCSSDEHYQDLREAFVCARFARALGFTECKLIDEAFPDASCRNTQKTLSIEITELVDKGRRRGDEVRNTHGLIQQNQELLDTVIANWDEWLIEAILKKSIKCYDAGEVELVIYMNISLYDWPSERIKYYSKMQKIAEKLKNSGQVIPFPKVWVLHQDNIQKIWPDYQQVDNDGYESIAA